MDRTGSSDLKKALEFIKASKLDKARPLLVEVLRREPKNAQAWFLLSYALSDLQRKQYALLQAIQADPDFARARERLEKLSREQTEITPAATQPVAVEPAPPPLSPPAPVPQEPVPFTKESRLPPGAEGDAAFFDVPPKELEPGEFELAEKKPLSFWRVLFFPVLFAFLIIVGYLAFQFLQRPAASVHPTRTPASSATLPPTFTPTSQPAATLGSTPTPAFQVSRVDANTLAQMQTIQQQVSAERGLQANTSPDHALLSESDASAFIANTFFSQDAAQLLQKQEHILRALGLLIPESYLIDYEFNRHVDPLGGVYSSSQNTIYLVGDSFSGVLPYVYSRLFTAALLHQNHSSVELDEASCTLFSDVCRASHALLLGDIALTGAAWLQSSGGSELSAAVDNFESDPLLVQVQQPADFVLQELIFPYQQGLAFVQAVFDDGGWEAVDALYEDPPLSSEQILDPEKYLAGETPIAITDTSFGSVLGSGWEPLGTGALGEWLTRQLFTNAADASARLTADVSAAAASGWGGDVFQAYLRASDSAVALAAHWVMDSDAAASELLDALANYQELRFLGEATNLGSGECRIGEARRSCVFVSGSEVLWLLGPDEIVVLQVMLSHYPQFE